MTLFDTIIFAFGTALAWAVVVMLALLLIGVVAYVLVEAVRPVWMLLSGIARLVRPQR